MRIVLSRKGFDSANGGMPSPIMTDKTLLPLPIPSKADNVLYSELFHSGKSYYEIIKDINPKCEISEKERCHLDPDIRRDIKKRNNNWFPLFGQANAAAGHLINKKVGEGDIFLFFGWFKQINSINDRLVFEKDAMDLHVIWGYMQVEKVYRGDKGFPNEFSYHPHFKSEAINNCIYKATDELSLLPGYPGYGIFRYNDKLVLTQKEKSRSRWNLPDSFKGVKISYHSEKSRKKDYFQSASIGQEFVIEANEEILNWVKKIIRVGAYTQ